jgi:hypothetical protein
MISKEGFYELVKSAGEAYNIYCEALEILGMNPDSDSYLIEFIDKTLGVAANEMGDYDKTELIARLGDDCDIDNANYWTPDMPLVIHFAWNLRFGDGGLDGSVTKIKLEGQDYELNTAADLYECLSHFNQLRAHYGVE